MSSVITTAVLKERPLNNVIACPPVPDFQRDVSPPVGSYLLKMWSGVDDFSMRLSITRRNTELGMLAKTIRLCGEISENRTISANFLILLSTRKKFLIDKVRRAVGPSVKTE